MIDLLYPVGVSVPVLPALSSAQVQKKRKNDAEMLPVVQEDGVVIAMAPRSYCHGGAHILHPVVHLYVIDRQERIYLQLRSQKKKLFPGKWDVAVGGHVIYGESVLEALFRESEEELHLREFNPRNIGSYCYDTPSDYELVNIFAITGNYSPAPDKVEVESGRWWTVKEIEKELRSDVFTPMFVSEFKKIKHKLLASL